MFYLSYYLKVLLKPVTFSKGYTDYQTGNNLSIDSDITNDDRQRQ